MGHVAHCLDFIRNGLFCRCMSKANRRVVGNRTIDATAVWDEVYVPPEDGCRFMQLFGIYRRIEAMNMAPSRLLVGMRVVIGSEVDAYNVIRP